MNKLIVALIAVNIFALSSNGFAQSKGRVTKDTLVFTQIIQNPEIDKVNQLYRAKHPSKNTIEGYKIQIFFGKRDEAKLKLDEFLVLYPEIPATMIYEEPDFKVIIGNYRSKLDADREINKIRSKYKSAFIILSKIEI